MTSQSKLAYYDERRMPRAVARHYLAQFNGAPKILDVGCGTGELGRHRGESGFEIHGVDGDPGAVQKARRFEHALCLDLESGALPYEDESFDAVLARDILEHLHDPNRLAHEIYRVIRPGGLLVASVVMARPRKVWADYTHVRGFTLSSARLLLEDAGFRVDRIYRMGPVPLSSRLGFVKWVPLLLRLPVVNQVWATSWEVVARRPEMRRTSANALAEVPSE
jgi:SAM-dependent methyltransferase